VFFLQEQRKSNFLKGAAILAATGVFVKIVGAIYQIPILRVMGDEGAGYFHVTYMVYAFILAISTAGVPVALSRLISSSIARSNYAMVRKYFSVAMPTFIIVGTVAMLIMFFFADQIAELMNTSLASYGIRVLAPAVFFVCIISVLRGYAQGFEDMVPTAISQVIEVVSKAVIGIAVVFFLSGLGYEAQFVSAGAITGVTIGLGLCVPVMIWYKKRIERTHSDNSLVSQETSYQNQNSSVESAELPTRKRTFLRIMKVSIPISISATFMSIMGVVDTSIVSGRLQHALMLTETEAVTQLGLLRKGLSIYNIPPSLIVPLAVSIIPAIASAIARENKREVNLITHSSLKLMNLFTMPACVGISILAGPILRALYYNPDQAPEAFASMTLILTILGVAGYFVCFQHISISILQANGHERVSLITFPIGAAVKIVLSYILVGNPNFGIIGSPIGTFACFATIVTLNLIFIKVRVKQKFNFVNSFLRPLLCTITMAAAAYFSYNLAYRFGSRYLGTSNMSIVLFLAFAVFIGVAVYCVMVVLTRTISKEDLSHIPKGEKLAKLLRVR